DAVSRRVLAAGGGAGGARHPAGAIRGRESVRAAEPERPQRELLVPGDAVRFPRACEGLGQAAAERAENYRCPVPRRRTTRRSPLTSVQRSRSPSGHWTTTAEMSGDDPSPKCARTSLADR